MATAMQSEANVPLLCAPAHITRYAGKFEKLSQNSWRVPAGDPSVISLAIMAQLRLLGMIGTELVVCLLIRY